MSFPLDALNGDIHETTAGVRYSYDISVRVWRKEAASALTNNDVTQYVMGTVNEEGVAIFETYFSTPFISTGIYTGSKIVPGTGDELFFNNPINDPVTMHQRINPDDFISGSDMTSKNVASLVLGTGDELSFSLERPHTESAVIVPDDLGFMSSSLVKDMTLNLGDGLEGEMTSSVLNWDTVQSVLIPNNDFVSTGIYSNIELTL